jgi:hypothetical protein
MEELQQHRPQYAFRLPSGANHVPSLPPSRSDLGFRGRGAWDSLEVEWRKEPRSLETKISACDKMFKYTLGRTGRLSIDQRVGSWGFMFHKLCEMLEGGDRSDREWDLCYRSFVARGDSMPMIW